jgi:probable HAF family extracellular repeat protein
VSLTGINSGGQIVGYSTPSVGIPHAFLYSNATMTDLNSLVSNLPSGVYLEYATAINDSGQIVAQANNNLAYLLTPNTTTTPLQLIPVAPCRIMDTRNPDAPLGGPTIPAGATRAIPVPSSSCGIPSSAAAYSLNVTVVPRAGVLNYLTVWPTGQSQPLVSTLNSLDGEILANAAIVPAGTGGSIEAFATDETDLVIDIDGYFVPPTTGSLQFYPLTPCRILDTRKTPNRDVRRTVACASGEQPVLPDSVERVQCARRRRLCVQCDGSAAAGWGAGLSDSLADGRAAAGGVHLELTGRKSSWPTRPSYRRGAAAR